MHFVIITMFIIRLVEKPVEIKLGIISFISSFITSFKAVN
jgi:hypothetical protein